MSKFVATRSTPILKILIYAISYYYVFVASVNDGFSGCILGLPFATFLFADCIYNRTSKLNFLTIAVFVISAVALSPYKAQSNFIYPHVGKTYELIDDIEFTYGFYSTNEINTQYMNSSENKDKTRYTIRKGQEIKILKQFKTGNPDFGITYKFEIYSPAFAQPPEFTANTTIDSVNRFYKDRNKTYISGNNLQPIIAASGHDYRMYNRFTNTFK